MNGISSNAGALADGWGMKVQSLACQRRLVTLPNLTEV